MATVYVSSVDGSDADSGADWTNAKATIAGALLLCTGSTNIIYVDSAHAYVSSGAGITWNMPNDGAVSIISVNRGTMARQTGASETVGTNAFACILFSANFSNSYYVYGMTVQSASGTSATNTLTICSATAASIAARFVSCTLSCRSTNTSAGVTAFILGCTSGASNIKPQIVFKTCAFNIANQANQKGISLRVCDVMIHNSTVGYSGGAKPLILFTSGTGSSSGKFNLKISDCDLSGYEASGGAYFEVANWAEAETILRNCKLSPTPSLTTGAWLTNVSSITMINVDSGDTNNVFEYRNRLGTITENSSIYANRGAKFNGSGISWEIVTSSFCSEYENFVTPWLFKWVESIVSTTVGFRVVHDSATDLNDRNAWQEIEYISDASFPKGTMLSGRSAVPFDGTAVDWTNDSEAWTGTGGFSNPNTQTRESTFTPAEKSLIRGRLLFGIASKTIYLDPALRVTDSPDQNRVRWTNEGAFNEPQNIVAPIFGGNIV